MHVYAYMQSLCAYIHACMEYVKLCANMCFIICRVSACTFLLSLSPYEPRVCVCVCVRARKAHNSAHAQIIDTWPHACAQKEKDTSPEVPCVRSISISACCHLYSIHWLQKRRESHCSSCSCYSFLRFYQGVPRNVQLVSLHGSPNFVLVASDLNGWAKFRRRNSVEYKFKYTSCRSGLNIRDTFCVKRHAAVAHGLPCSS
jgi:hypothetical protein